LENGIKETFEGSLVIAASHHRGAFRFLFPSCQLWEKSPDTTTRSPSSTRLQPLTTQSKPSLFFTLPTNSSSSVVVSSLQSLFNPPESGHPSSGETGLEVESLSTIELEKRWTRKGVKKEVGSSIGQDFRGEGEILRLPWIARIHLLASVMDLEEEFKSLDCVIEARSNSSSTVPLFTFHHLLFSDFPSTSPLPRSTRFLYTLFLPTFFDLDSSSVFSSISSTQ